MFTDAFSDKIVFRRQFVRQIIGPLGAAIVIVLALASFGMYRDADQGDAIAADRQAEIAKRALADIVDVVALQQQSVALWTPMLTHLQEPVLDVDWMDENVGSWLNQMFGHQEVYVLDANDRPIYAAIFGKRVDPARFEEHRQALMRLLDGVRGRSALPNDNNDRLPGQPLPPSSTVLTSAEARHDSWTILEPAIPA